MTYYKCCQVSARIRLRAFVKCLVSSKSEPSEKRRVFPGLDTAFKVSYLAFSFINAPRQSYLCGPLFAISFRFPQPLAYKKGGGAGQQAPNAPRSHAAGLEI